MNIFRWVVTVIGWAFLAVLISILIEETPFFLQTNSRTFWIDAQNYLLQKPSSKSLEELQEEYGEETVKERILEPDFRTSYLPSEDAAFVNMIGYARKQNGSNSSPVIWTIFLIVFYLPMIVAARQTQWILSRLVCRTKSARSMREEYFERVRRSSWKAALTGFAITILLCVLNNMWVWTPATGLSWLDMLSSLVVLSYLSGLWIRLVSHLLETVLLAGGHDPDESLWDNVISLVLVAPVLYFVYQNSLLIIVTSASAGLASDLYRKWRHGRSNAIVSF